VDKGTAFLCVGGPTATRPDASLWGLAVPAAATLVTSLPVSPVDGQEIVFVDSLTAPTYHWHLRYIAAKASNKWVFVGGFPAHATNYDVMGANLSSTTYVDPSTVCSLTVPLAGSYRCTYIQHTSGTAGYIGFVSLKKGSAATADADSPNVDGSANFVFGQREIIVTGLAAGDVLKLQGKVNTSSMTLRVQRLSVIPQAVG